VFDFLLAYGEPKATITRLKKGDLNQLEAKGEVTQRKKLFFKEATANLHGVIDTLRIDSATQKQKPRFIIVTDYETLLAYDTKTTDTLDIKFKDLAKHYDFFLPLAGMEKSTYIDENPADVKASNQLAKLYDEILKNNPTQTHEEVHSLNVFLTRLLFCYFAEDSMPQDLKEAHHQLDLTIEKCYRNKPFENDEERLEYLFKLYEEMIKAEGT
jgi:uncharacterized protein YqiB (DUF1249 family)